jgi:hypothetical protein
MKRAISCTCLAAAFAVGLSAQTPAPSAPMQSDKDTKPVAMTGCLRAGDAPGSFVLANAKMAATASKDQPGAPTGTAGAAPAMPPAPAGAVEGKTIALSGSPTGVTLSNHVGHTVEITGVMASMSATVGGGAKTPPPDPGGMAGMAAKAQPTLNISAFKMVSGTCAM